MSERLLVGLWLLVALGGCGSSESQAPQSPSSGENTQDPSFSAFEFGEHTDPTKDRLCKNATNPDKDSDPLHPDCPLAGEDLSKKTTDKTESFRLFAYNLERGYQLDGQLEWLASKNAQKPDIVVLSEADRGCSRTDYRYVAREWAQALDMDFIFAVEFEEVSFDENGKVSEVCEHGNALLTRAPLGNVKQIRFEDTDDWNNTPDEREYPTSTRFGGRVAIRAELNFGDNRVRIYGAHFASGAFEDSIRKGEIQEILADAKTSEVPVVVTGDLNTFLYKLDLQAKLKAEIVTESLLGAGYKDSHASIDYTERTTDQVDGYIIDLAFGRGVTFKEPWIGSKDEMGPLSDHLPIATTVVFDK